MPIWLIEVFGASDLEGAFLLILLMTAPVWIAMIAFPYNRAVRQLAQPMILPPLYCIVLFFLLWNAYKASVTPEILQGVGYSQAKEFAEHPIAFLALYCNLQILNLALGTMIFQKAHRSGLRAPVELFMCWLVGAPALLVFQIRLLIVRRSLR
jgi:hypothetical protein